MAFGTRHGFIFFLVTLVTIEILLGGGGRLLAYGPVSLRTVIFIFVVVTFFLWVIVLSNRKDLQRLLLKICGFVGIFLLCFSTVGFMHGATVLSIFMDMNSYVVLLYIVLFYYFFLLRQKNISYFFSMFNNCALFIAFFSMVFFGMAIMGLFDLRILDDVLNAHAYGGNSGMMFGYIPRIHFVSQTIIQFALSILLARMFFERGYFQRNKIRAIGQTCLYLTVLIITYTRGYWLGMAVSIFILSCWAGIKKTAIMILCGGGMLAVIVAGMVISGTYEFNTLSTRLKSSFESGSLDENQGNLVRLLQVQQSLKQISANPLLGVGHGVPMPEAFYEARSAITGKEYEGTEVVIELSYLDLARKVGVIGFSLLIFFAWRYYRRTKVRLRYAQRYLSDFPLYLGYYAGFVGFLVSAGTNPYLLASSGLFFIVILVSLIESISRRSW